MFARSMAVFVFAGILGGCTVTVERADISSIRFGAIQATVEKTCVACPPGVIHGNKNTSLKPVWFLVLPGRGRPETMGYADDELFQRRDAHLKAI